VKLGLAGAPVRRTYSIASAPHETHLEFCIEQVPGGRFTSRLGEVSVGDRLELAPKPKAGIELLPGFTKHVMVATVTGIAPLRSLLRHALHGEKPSGSAAPAFWVLHGASYADELPYAGELAELERSGRVAYLPTVSRPSETRNRGWSGRQGRVEAHVLSLLESLGPANGVAVYACGHPEMVRGVREMLTPLGYRVEVEAF
jgi:ferredoxin--NADP+ reductase